MKRAGRAADRGRKVEDSFFGEDPFQSFRRFAAAAACPREPDSLLCRHLRGKAWSVIHPAVDPPDSGEPFLCLKTLRRWGPDASPVRIDHCNDERGCFEPADSARDSS